MANVEVLIMVQEIKYLQLMMGDKVQLDILNDASNDVTIQMMTWNKSWELSNAKIVWLYKQQKTLVSTNQCR